MRFMIFFFKFFHHLLQLILFIFFISIINPLYANLDLPKNQPLKLIKLALPFNHDSFRYDKSQIIVSIMSNNQLAFPDYFSDFEYIVLLDEKIAKINTRLPVYLNTPPPNQYQLQLVITAKINQTRKVIAQSNLIYINILPNLKKEQAGSTKPDESVYNKETQSNYTDFFNQHQKTQINPATPYQVTEKAYQNQVNPSN